MWPGTESNRRHEDFQLSCRGGPCAPIGHHLSQFNGLDRSIPRPLFTSGNIETHGTRKSSRKTAREPILAGVRFSGRNDNFQLSVHP